MMPLPDVYLNFTRISYLNAAQLSGAIYSQLMYKATYSTCIVQQAYSNVHYICKENSMARVTSLFSTVLEVLIQAKSF